MSLLKIKLLEQFKESIKTCVLKEEEGIGGMGCGCHVRRLDWISYWGKCTVPCHVSKERMTQSSIWPGGWTLHPPQWPGVHAQRPPTGIWIPFVFFILFFSISFLESHLRSTHVLQPFYFQTYSKCLIEQLTEPKMERRLEPNETIDCTAVLL